jgi:hypothetical protein
MKHLRKYNEEWYPDTYRETGEVLKKKGHYKQGAQFIDHAKLLEDNADRKIWEKYKAKYEKYGEVEIKFTTNNIDPKKLKAYPVLNLEIGEFEDFYSDKDTVQNSGYGEFTLIEGYVISNEEDYEWIRTSYMILDNFGNTKSYKYIEGGYFQTRRIIFRIEDGNDGFEIIDPEISGLDTEDDPDTRSRYLGIGNKYPNRGFMISDYKNAGKVRNLILKCLTDPSFDYPSDIDGLGYDSMKNMYGVIQRMIISNWSINFGINDSEDFADEFKKKYPSPFDIFKEI